MYCDKIKLVNWICERVDLDAYVEKITISKHYILFQTQSPYTLMSELAEHGVEADYFECIEHRVVMVMEKL